jgi:hypothetical protein
MQLREPGRVFPPDRESRGATRVSQQNRRGEAIAGFRWSRGEKGRKPFGLLDLALGARSTLAGKTLGFLIVRGIFATAHGLKKTF